ncbi:hypothetical protein [Glycomyces albidus]|jgi:hypothetical protein|uniref:Uncharacterized protein n=1 Tax=Glycomyces albidus TaxID=2656774 RepID=A0A6L5G7N8_9ACTN|nr:hypothetical protein [Glycomyces albidus]MQM25670.1 hypothetical protein [Glycomyces albidus]
MAVSDDDRSVELDEDFSVLPDQTSDDTDRGWGEAPRPRPTRRELSVRDLDLLAERPPHWS